MVRKKYKYLIIISRISNSVAHLWSYTNTTIARNSAGRRYHQDECQYRRIKRQYHLAERQYRRIERQVFHHVLQVFHDAL